MKSLRCPAIAFALAALAASCAPRVAKPPELDTGTVSGRYLRALEHREELGRAMDAEVSMWVEGESFGKLPGVQGTLLLGGPDACRLRVRSLLGTLLDITARGDTITALLPGKRQALDLPRAGDTLGVRDPGTLAYRVWSAAWRPPDGAWPRTKHGDTMLVVRWKEAEDAIEMQVDAEGRPTAVKMIRTDGAEVRCRYRGWGGVQSVSWPNWLEFEDGAGAVHAECRISSLRPRSNSSRERLAVHVPPDAKRLEWSTIRAAIERLGNL